MYNKNNVLELDEKQGFLTDLGLENTQMYEDADAENIANMELAERMKITNLAYYQDLMEKKRRIIVRFTGHRERSKTESHMDELFVLCGQTELVYPIERILSAEEPDWPALLEQEYMVHVVEIIPEERRVILGDKIAQTRREASRLIDAKLAKNETVYLRGNIVGLQRNGGKHAARHAAYVNIEGLGILGIIRIQSWSVGFVSESEFCNQINSNRNAIVNFAVKGKGTVPYGRRERRAYICDRSEYLKAIGYNPWKIVEKKYPVRTDCVVRIVEKGKDEGCFFGAFDGISDFNVLCYKDDHQKLSIEDIVPGKYYHGYVQKVNIEKKFMRVRITRLASQGSIREVTAEKVEPDKSDEVTTQ